MTALAGSPVALVLAAGRSERMGAEKYFAPVEGQAIVERVLHALLAAPRVTDVVLVTREDDAADFSWLKSVRVHLASNPDPSRGPISSVRVGLRTAWAQGRAFLLCPADVPYLKTDVVTRVIQTFLARDCRIVVPTYKGLGGHPCLFAASLADDFFLHGDAQGVREVLAKHPRETVHLNVADPDVCFDVDTPEDLKVAPDPGGRWARVERDVEEWRRTRRG